MSNPFLEPTRVYMYTLRPRRLEIVTDGPTPEEAAVVGRHWQHLLGLKESGKLIFAGRTLLTSSESFATVVFRAETSDEAESMMNADPAVVEGVMESRLYPYQALLSTAI